MKTKDSLFITLAFCLLPCLTVWGQGQGEAIQAILGQIETNNRELRANARQTDAQKLENRASNNLPNPTLSYAHLWDSKDKDITVGEMVVSQSFDFPTLYAGRNKLNRSLGSQLDAQVADFRQTLLLQAKELCLDLIMLGKQQQLLDERLKNAEDMAEYYGRRLETGDANALETNKINLELLNVRTEARLNRNAIESRMRQLQALNADMPLTAGRPLPGNPTPTVEALGLTSYPDMPLPENFSQLCDELLAASPALQALESQSEAARRQLSVSRQGWLPQLELGYRRNTESGHPLNGIVVGFSFPLFENRGKVKAARTQAISTDFLKEDARLKASSALWQLYEEARTLQSSIREYEETFNRQQDLTLLRQALDGGQISMIEYFVEVSTLYQSRANLLQLENQYQKAMARLYKCRL